MFIMNEFREGGETVKAVLAKLLTREEMTPASYISVISRAIEQGQLKPLDPLQLIATIIGSCLFFFVAEPMLHNLFQLDDDFDRESFIEERKEAVFNTIAYGVFPGGKE
jgi:TetR/AcrR family transcriptional regulator